MNKTEDDAVAAQLTDKELLEQFKQVKQLAQWTLIFSIHWLNRMSQLNLWRLKKLAVSHEQGQYQNNVF